MKREKLAKYLGVPSHEVCFSYKGTYVDNQDSEYWVLTKSEAYFQAVQNVLGSLYYQDDRYLADLTGLDASIFVTLQTLDKKVVTPALHAIITATIGIPDLMDDVLASDGLGGVLAKHDGIEIDLGDDCFAYKIGTFY